jgi:hypothetical protein
LKIVVIDPLEMVKEKSIGDDTLEVEKYPEPSIKFNKINEIIGHLNGLANKFYD